MSDFGFIILRHVNSKKTDYYWKESYKCIRKFYPDAKIIIIDDNSNYKLVSKFKTENCEIVQSEFPARGELLPYYYYARNNWFSRAVILHDSVFIKKKKLPIETFKNYLPFWHFVHKHMQFHPREKEMLMRLDNNEKLVRYHEKKNKWMGIFGAQGMVEHDYIKMIDEKYKLANLLPVTRNRYDRMCFERVIACILHHNDPDSKDKQSWLGNHHKYAKRYYYPDYIHKKYSPKLPLVKIRTGR